MSRKTVSESKANNVGQPVCSLPFPNLASKPSSLSGQCKREKERTDLPTRSAQATPPPRS